ncbi:L-idonate 5-dehydrogenase [Trueperella sp. LYQ143]|uniref:L-idonate 5-dehydrogenase n=1 Tax=Trueperella sp. LYQ143 TaxID=3391059 RepID=UPI0039835BF7
MRAFVIQGAQDAQVTDVPTPTPAEGKVLVRVAYVGICGSDLHYYFEGANGDFTVREPFIPGHELSGTIAADPSGRYPVGTPVTVHPARFGTEDPRYGRHLWNNGSYLGSASTWPHTQGAMSDYLLVEDFMIRELPADTSLRTAALAEPLAVGLHGIAIAGGVDGKKVLVSGSGPIGLLAVAGAKESGAGEVWATDLRSGPLQRAERLGADRTVNVAQEELPADYFDVVLECTGIPSALNSCIPALCKAGVIGQIGMFSAGDKPINMSAMLSKEAQIRGAFRFDDEIDRAIEILAGPAGDHIRDAVVTHTIDIADAVSAFHIAKDSEQSGKVLVDLTGATEQ